MALHGHTKIQLFNGKTGKLEQTVEDDNVVTDAVNQILNPPDYIVHGMYGGTVYNTVLHDTTAYYAYFGGVLLFSDPIDETKVYPPYDNYCVGNAGDVNADTESRRGTLNSTESGAITNGYRWVWDFATDRACGDISCVCLTSRAGGNLGIPCLSSYCTSFAKSGRDFNASSSYYSEYAIAMNYNTGSTNNFSFTDLQGIYMNQLSNGNIRVIAINGADYNKTSLYEIIISDPHKLNLMGPEPGRVISITQVYEKKNNCYNGCAYVYNGKIHVVYDDTSDNTTIHHDILDLDDYSEDSSKTVTCEFAMKASSYRVMYYWNNMYFVTRASDNYLCTVDSNGSLLTEYSGIAQQKGFYVDDESNTAMALYYNRTNYSYLGWYKIDRYYCNKDNNYYFSTESSAINYTLWNNSLEYTEQIMKVEGHPFPFICQGIFNKYSFNSYRFAITWGAMYDYLGTINNLSTKVKKTSEQTMKITYDITQT